MRFVDRRSFELHRAKALKPLKLQAAQATEALLRMVDEGREPKFNPALLRAYMHILVDLFRSKCAYCESAVGVSAPGQIERYRPKSLYLSLAYDWPNLLLTCSVCQRYKADRFPIAGSRPNLPVQDISAEKPLLLLPTKDRPEKHLIFTADKSGRKVRAAGLTERGQTSILILGLNREDLVRVRGEYWTELRLMLDRMRSAGREQRVELQQLYKALSDASPYVGVLRQLARGWLDRNKAHVSREVAELIVRMTLESSKRNYEEAERNTEAMRRKHSGYSLEEQSKETRRQFSFTAKRIERIEVRNLRAIHDLDLWMPAPRENESWIMAIGENGVGKSSLLQGITLALMGENRANRRRLKASDFVRARGRSGFVRVHVSGVGPIELTYRKGSSKFKVNPRTPKVPLLAYGPTRLLPRATAKAAIRDRNIRVENLFDPTVPLCDPEVWLKQVYRRNTRVFKAVGSAICRLLMIEEKHVPRLRNGRIEIRMHDGWRSIRKLSDGYQTIIALAVDIAIGTSGTHRDPKDAEGIVILDEIEMHLHPQWKIMIVERLRQCFPRLNFLVTTHDPLCLKGLRDDEIVVLRRDQRDKVVCSTNVPSVNFLKTDEILTSDLFEVDSGRNPAVSVAIAQYSKLLDKKHRSKAETEELERLRRKIASTLSGALTPMQQQVADVIASVMKTLREGKRGVPLRKDVVAEIKRQAAHIGEPA